MNTSKLREMQHNIQQNSSDHQLFLLELEEWEKEMKRKDLEITNRKRSKNNASDAKRVTTADKKKDDTASNSNVEKSQENVSKSKGGETVSIKAEQMENGKHLVSERDVPKLSETKSTTACSGEKKENTIKSKHKASETKKEVVFVEERSVEPNNNGMKKQGKLSEVTTTSAEPEFGGGEKIVKKLENACSKKKESISTSPAICNDFDFTDSCIISPIVKSPDACSKKPLLRVKIKNVTRYHDEAICGPVPDPTSNNSSAVSPEVSAEVHPILPNIPTKSYQFIVDWNTMKSHPKLLFEYLRQFPPEKFPVLFENSMETDLMGQLLKIMDNYFISNQLDVCDYMKYLSHVGRFKTLLLMLSEDETACVKRLLDRIRQCSCHSDSEKSSLFNAYTTF